MNRGKRRAIILTCVLASYGVPAAGADALNGAWVPLAPPSGRQWSNVVFDAPRQRLVLFGGWDGGFHGDVWTFELAGPQGWQRLDVPGPHPAARNEAAEIYDPVRERMIIVGGYSNGYLNDVWALSLAGLVQWDSLGAFPAAPRTRAGAAYDAARDRIIVHGGSGGYDTWTSPLNSTLSWTQILAGGTLPPPAPDPVVVIDPWADRLLVTGIRGWSGARTDSVWTLSLGPSPTWSALAGTGGLPPREWGSGVIDPVRARLILFGGHDDASGWADDSRCLSLIGPPQWSVLSTIDPAPERRLSDVFYDPDTDRLLVHAGQASNAQYPSDIWAVPLDVPGSWTQIAPDVQRVYASPGIYDPVRRRLLRFGGYNGTTTLGGLWELPMSGDGRWLPVTTMGPEPLPRAGHSLVYDARRDRVLMFGGVKGVTYYGETWALSLDDPPTWTKLVERDTIPRAFAAMTWDPVRDRLLVFGGERAYAPPAPQYPNDLWTLHLDGQPIWAQLTPAGMPPTGRSRVASTYDPWGDRWILFGGYPLSGELWTLALSGTPSWTQQLPPGNAPASRYDAVAVLDPVRERMVMYGGSYPNREPWTLALGSPLAWAPLVPAGEWPTPRSLHTSAYDGPGDRLFISGGSVLGGASDTWTVEWGAPATISIGASGPVAGVPGETLVVHVDVNHPFGFPEPAEYRITTERHWPGFPLTGTLQLQPGQAGILDVPVVVPDTAAAGPAAVDVRVTWSVAPQTGLATHPFDVGAPVGVSPPTGATAIQLALRGATPSTAGIEVVCALRPGLTARLEVVDVTGRTVARRDLADVNGGRSVIRLAAAGQLRPGLYFVRLVQGTTSRVVRSVVLR